MFKPKQEQSAQTHQLINQIFTNKVPQPQNFTVAYAYYMKSGIFSNKMYSYVIGFSSQNTSIVLIPLDSEGNSGDAIVLTAQDILSVKTGMQGDTRIVTRNNKTEYRFIVPGYTPTSLAGAYILPIVQEEQAISFSKFIKENF